MIPGHDPDENYRRRHEGIREFLRVFDQMRVRPTWRNGDIPVPVLWVTGPYLANAAVAQALEARCDGTPFAHIGTSADPEEGGPVAGAGFTPPYAGLVTQLRQATRDLAAVAPPGEAHLRFPLFAQVLWLLDLQTTDDEPDHLHDGVKKAVRQRRRQMRAGTGQDRRNFWANVRAYSEGPLPAWAAATALLGAGWANQLSGLFGVSAILAGPVIGSLHVLLLSRSWAGRRRYMWFCRQPFLMPDQRRNRPHDITGFAVRLLRARRRAMAVPLSEARPDVPPPAPAQSRLVAHVTPLPQVTAVPGDPDAGHPPEHEGAEGAEAPAESAGERKRLEAVQANEGIEHLLVNAFLEDLRQGYERRLWKVWRRVAWARTSYPVLLVDGGLTRLVARIEEVRTATCLPDPLLVVVTGHSGHTPPPDGARAPVMAGRPELTEELWAQWGAELARDRAVGSHRVLRIEMEAKDAPILEKINVPVRGRRRPLLAHPVLPWLAVTALVTLSFVRVLATNTTNCELDIWRAATGECVGISDGGFVFDDHLKHVLGVIDSQNRSILSSGHPYATVIYLGKLTTSSKSSVGVADPITDIHGELAGLALEQRRLIDNSGDGSKLQMRLLLANAGADFRYAEDVAKDVLRRIQDDPSVIGVVGLGESRQTVQAAIQLLARKAVPVISTTATFDDLGRRQGSDAYIPSFFPLAPPNSRLAEVAARWAHEGLPEQGFPPAATAAVFTDTMLSDLFSRDLGARFVRAFGKGATSVGYSNAAQLEEKVTDVCTRTEKPDMVYYAGRTAQFGAFVDAIGKSQCQLTVMANDDITQYVNDHEPQLGSNHRVRVTYVALASPSAWTAVPGQFKTDFFQEFDALVASLHMQNLPRTELPSKEYAVQAHDAAGAIMGAAQVAFSGQGGPADDGGPGVVDRGGVLLALEKLEKINGDSGLVKLHGDPDGRHALDRPILLVTVNPQGRQVVIRQCGRLYVQQPPSPTC
ncbi:ABC transporter substrate-binding protein [Sphaerisporangium corydalis]|uniref:ABC transporter substrate-binding protein n=1 Tax=Sphaerisporangium corydalis TaxID=1441875 RepID=A0ABV9E6I7_9ACTN|nr:ABC transporter substrate-binding protein [Sphaerisporangium corydalis]